MAADDVVVAVTDGAPGPTTSLTHGGSWNRNGVNPKIGSLVTG